MVKLERIVATGNEKRFRTDKRDAEREFLAFAMANNGLASTHRLAALKYEWQDQTHKLLFDAINHHCAQQETGIPYASSVTRRLAMEKAINQIGKAAEITPIRTDDELLPRVPIARMGWYPKPNEKPEWKGPISDFKEEPWDRDIFNYADGDGNEVIFETGEKQSVEIQPPSSENGPEKDRETGPKPSPDPPNEPDDHAPDQHAPGLDS